jgi:hypothetical protein
LNPSERGEIIGGGKLNDDCARLIMPKPESEFFRPDHLPWEPVAGSASAGAGGAGVRQKILSRDPPRAT